MAATIQFTGIQDAQAKTGLRGTLTNNITKKEIGAVTGVSLNVGGSTNVIDITGFAVADGDELKITMSEPVANGFVIVATGNVVATEKQQQLMTAGGAGDNLIVEAHTFTEGQTIRFRTALNFEGDDTTNKEILIANSGSTTYIQNAQEANRSLVFDYDNPVDSLPLAGFYHHGAMQTWEFNFLANNVIQVNIDGQNVGSVTVTTAVTVNSMLNRVRSTLEFVEYEFNGVIVFRAIPTNAFSVATSINTTINTESSAQARTGGEQYIFKRSGKYMAVDDYVIDNLEVLYDYGTPEAMTPPTGNYTLLITTGQSLGAGTYVANNRTYSVVSPKNTYFADGTTLKKYFPDKTRVENAFCDEYAHTTSENIVKLMIAKPSTDINGLSKGTANYTEFLGLIADINTALGGTRTINKVVINHIHGENDSNTNAITAYVPACIQYQTDLTADIRAIWAGVPVDFMISQIGNTFGSNAGKDGILAMCRAMGILHNPAEDRYTCAPRHYLNLMHPSAAEFDETHLNPIGYTRLGMDMMATYKQLIANGTYAPLRVVSATYSGNTITVTTNASTPLQFDQEITYSPSFGFTVEASNGDETLPISAEIISDTEIELTMSSPVAAGSFLWSYDGVSDGNNVMVNPIMDSANVIMDGRGRSLNNRLLVERVDITGA